jgi:hypothetical protein
MTEKFLSTDDKRTSNNVFRHEYRTLNPIEKDQMLAVKDKASEMWDLIDSIGASRELSLAKTQLELVVFWAVKHVTG